MHFQGEVDVIRCGILIASDLKEGSVAAEVAGCRHPFGSY
jgi:hypothetical protein